MRSRNIKYKREIHPLVAGVLLRFRERLLLLACWLQQKSNRLSLRSRKLFLLFFCVVVTIESVMLVALSFTKRTRIVYSVTPFKVVPAEGTRPSRPVISLTEYRRIQNFREYLDRLAPKSRDSLLANRPYLLDTLDFLRLIYQKQSKK